MKRKRFLAGVLAALLCCCLAPMASAVTTDGTLSDIQGHWAQAEIQAAIDQGWVDGYPDGTFRPNATITRAEFVKMLLAATHMTPDSNVILWMRRSTIRDTNSNDEGGWETYLPELSDVENHWFGKQGWATAATSSGIVVPDDYTGQNFQPNKNIQRYEIAVMADRALGLVFAAQKGETDALSFSDSSAIQDWAKGYVNEAVNAGVIQGYPDGTFGPKKTATRAEAVVMVSRALDYMEEGLQTDTNIVIQYTTYYQQLHQVTLENVTTQMIDGTLSVRCSMHGMIL